MNGIHEVTGSIPVWSTNLTFRTAPLEQGAKAVVRAREAAILNVPVTDPGCLRDVDTPDDYRELNSGGR